MVRLNKNGYSYINEIVIYGYTENFIIIIMYFQLDNFNKAWHKQVIIEDSSSTEVEIMKKPINSIEESDDSNDFSKCLNV